ncbi:MAG: hypothetical protein DI539_20240 [Flavobacterium psychrophilum]|nr:MAG: hypothetical protein DI539_20240 [Flavobacterium psychrophilum]
MQYKSIRFIVSLITSIILLGHSLVPHHHADQHAPGHHHEHHKHEHKGISDLFSHHCHSADCFTSIQKHEVSKTVYQQLPATIQQQSQFIALQAYHKPVKQLYDCKYIYISPHLVSLDFRGPPSQSV